MCNKVDDHCDYGHDRKCKAYPVRDSYRYGTDKVLAHLQQGSK
jgi:hypothetical protein